LLEALKQRIAPGDDDVGVVAFGHPVLFVHPGRHLAEGEPGRCRLGRPRGADERRLAEQDGGGGDAEATLEHVAAAVAAGDDGTDRFTGLRRQRRIVEGLEGLGFVGELVRGHGWSFLPIDRGW